MTAATTRSPARTDLLGVVASTSLASFEQAAAACALAPAAADKIVLARLAAGRLARFERIRDELERNARGAEAAMIPFVAPMSSLDAHTRPVLWAEACLKLHVLGGLARDAYEGVQEHLDDDLRDLLASLLDDDAARGELERMVVAARDADPDLRGRMALFGRRVLGETLSQAQRVAASRPGLTAVLTGTQEGSDDDLAAISDLMARLGTAYVRRMEHLGLLQ